MRRYEVIWLRIKKEKKVVLEVIPEMKARVKKAVIKEKDMDLGFKLLNENDAFRLLISYDEKTKHLVFRLKARYGLEEMKV